METIKVQDETRFYRVAGEVNNIKKVQRETRIGTIIKAICFVRVTPC